MIFRPPISGRGVARLRKGDLDGAIADFTKVLARNPRDADAYYNRGLARGNKGDRDEAIKDLQKAADLYQQQGETSIYQKVLNTIKQLQGMVSG
jgi:tetratricopeptide (TPR) repeat protein